jgi:Arc/MetJ-type ribon-helix-helix transcriptional regulator
MSKPKKSLINLSLDSDFLEMLKEQAKTRGFEKVSDYIQDWLKKLSLEKTDVKRVILQIPEVVFNNKPTLELWLDRRSEEISKHYFKEE